MKFENTKVMNFENAIRGMRNPKNSWNKIDTVHKIMKVSDITDEIILYQDNDFAEVIKIGDNDLKLMQTLIKAGSEHRKFMRQIFVSVDITAPLYWWKEADTYKVGTVANSTSTMHKLASTPITKDCFEMDNYSDINEAWNNIINTCETLRQLYNETNNKVYWKELIRLLPESWLQTRTFTCNYENLLAICSKGQRRFHKLNEWSGIDDNTKPNFISWARTLPYAKELIFIDEK